MPRDRLNNPPLVEAILEVRWALQKQSQGVETDPNYKLLVGRLYDKVAAAYPHHEPLPQASMPDELLHHVVQHRFRSKEGEWPLIQIGPGIVTLNDTNKYDWPDFKNRGRQLVEQLFETYPHAKETLLITHLQLKYIDAIPFDYAVSDILQFIRDNLGIQMQFPKKFFDGTGIASRASALNALYSFPLEKPLGTLNVHLGSGLHDGAKIVLWETIVQSDNEQIVPMPESFTAWYEAAHTLADDMFFKLIEGPLLERFR